MHDAVERVRLIMLKGQLGQRFAIERTVPTNHRVSEGLHDRRVDRLSRLHQLPPQLIGGNHRRALLREHAGHGALAAAQTSRQTNAKHLDRQPAAELGRAHSVGHQHGNGERPNAARHRRIGAG